MANDRDLLVDILVAARRIADFVAGYELESFLRDERTCWAVHSQFVVLGEAARSVSESFQEAHPEIPWREMIGMRNRMAHGYNTIDWTIVWQTATERVPALALQLEASLESP